MQYLVVGSAAVGQRPERMAQDRRGFPRPLRPQVPQKVWSTRSSGWGGTA